VKLWKKFALLAAVVLLIVAWRPLAAMVVNAYFDFPLISTPSNPASGFGRLYVNSGTSQLGCVLSTGSSCAPSGGGGSFYQTVQANGSSATQAATLNFANGTGVTWTCTTATMVTTCTATNTVTGPTTNQNIRSVSVLFDGGGVALSGTVTRCSQVNYAGTIQKTTIVADQSGSATVDVRTVAYGSYTGPSSASTITASDTPALSTAVKYQDSSLTGWTTSLSANTVVCFVLSSPSTVTWLAANIQLAAN
jgi:hypothetical protein